MKQLICITFAAPVGSSKTPISNYLSGKLNLPIYNNDAVRSEILEDKGSLDEEEFYQIIEKRIKDILARKISFILDASVDRRWKQLKEWLERYNYKWIIISIDLNKDFLAKLYKAKGYVESLQRIDKILADHKKFLQEFSAEVNIWINEKNFAKRLEVCYQKIKDILKDS